MILWVNGAFGSGKSSVAESLSKVIPNSYVYDPEYVGYFLWEMFPDNMKRKGNFQHIPLWREMNYKVLKHIDSNYDGVIIAPQTIYVKQYYDEIIGNLINDGILIKHFILSAEKDTIIDRLVQRGSLRDGWESQHIDVCISAYGTDIPEKKIITDNKSIDDIVSEIIELSELII